MAEISVKILPTDAPAFKVRIAATTTETEEETTEWQGNVHASGRIGGALSAEAKVHDTKSEVTDFQVRSVTREN